MALTTLLAKPDAAQQALLDLQWVVDSPSFVDGANVAPPATFDASAVDAEHLAAFLSTRTSHRVGHYFEALVLYWLTHVRKVELVGSGLQIRDGKRTIGEIDFLFRDEAGVLTHWEAAVKFFLHHPNPNGSHFPGPNASDNFERKVARLFEHQLQMSTRHFPEVEVRQAFVKGQVFYHPRAERPSELPARMPRVHRQGTWVRVAELHLIDYSDRHLCATVEKPCWFAPQVDAPLAPLPTIKAQLRDHFTERQHPLMLTLRHPETNQELDRLFVVSDTWGPGAEPPGSS